MPVVQWLDRVLLSFPLLWSCCDGGCVRAVGGSQKLRSVLGLYPCSLRVVVGFLRCLNRFTHLSQNGLLRTVMCVCVSVCVVSLVISSNVFLLVPIYSFPLRGTSFARINLLFQASFHNDHLCSLHSCVHHHIHFIFIVSDCCASLLRHHRLRVWTSFCILVFV